jgi:hypothetical protein
MLVSLLLGLLTSRAEDLEYELELGGGLGTGFYLGDVNSTPFAHLGGMGGVVARRIFNPRMAIKANLNYLKIEGDVSGAKNFYPATSGTASPERLTYSFSGALYDLSALYELHFLPYGYLPTYMGYHKLVPYLQIGLGVAYGDIDKSIGFTIPMGVGVKYKVARRWNLGLDWRMNFTTNDGFDGLEAPMGVPSSGFKNKDHYSTLLFSVTYDLSPKCPTCNKY